MDVAIAYSCESGHREVVCGEVELPCVCVDKAFVYYPTCFSVVFAKTSLKDPQAPNDMA